MRKIWSKFLFFLFFAAGLQAQEIKERLYKAGFENIQIQEKEDSLEIFFEHREFRSPYHSMRYANLLLAGTEK